MSKKKKRDYKKCEHFIEILDDRIYLRKRESGRWFYYFRYKNQTFRKSCGTTNLDRGKEFSIQQYWYVRHQEGLIPKTINFHTLCDKYIEVKKGRVKENTLRDYESNVKFLKDYFGNTKIQSISEMDLEKYKKWRQTFYEKHGHRVRQVYERHGKKLSGRKYHDGKKNYVLNREIGSLIRILTWSKRQGYLPESHPIPRWEKLEEKRRDVLLTKTQYHELKGYLESKWEDSEKRIEKTKKRRENDRFLLDVIQFVLNTGIRYPSEFQIQWKDVSLDKNFVSIKGKGRRGKEKKRGVPIFGISKKILEKYEERWFRIHNRERKDVKKPNPDDFVFVKENGDIVKHVRKSFKRSLRKCNLPENITLYSLRHSFVTKTLVDHPEVSTKVISEIVGHKDSSMIDRFYGHLRTQNLVDIMKKSHERLRNIQNDSQKPSSHSF